VTELERLRFYLRDPAGASQFFSDDELDELLEYTESFEEAIGLGWLVRAAAGATGGSSGAAGAVTSRTIGKLTESYSTSSSTSPSTSALAMANYWFGLAGKSVGRWWSLEPSDSFIGELHTKIKALALDGYYDLSRLLVLP
jgi:hypothetical protein